jgi:hypothetical protein
MPPPLPTALPVSPPNAVTTGNGPKQQVRPFGEWYRATWLSRKSGRIQILVWAACGFAWIPYWYFWTATPSGSLRGKWGSLGLGGKIGYGLLTGVICLLAVKGAVNQRPHTSPTGGLPSTAARKSGNGAPGGEPVTDSPQPAAESTRPRPNGRELAAKVGAVGDWYPNLQATLKAVKCYATSDMLIIEFDVGSSRLWDAKYAMTDYPFLVRLFDRNGQYLTHFMTSEDFTASPETYDTLSKRIGGPKLILLKPNGNRLAYPVNMRDLRDASIVEFGFCERAN